MRVTVVVLAYLDEPWLERSVTSALASDGIHVDVVIVDNGCTSGALAGLREHPRVAVVGDGTNLGFAGGCNLGASRATGDLVALLNADAVCEPSALARLADVAAREDVGIATASVRLAEDPETINSAGNPLHYLGLVWSGGFGEPASSHRTERDVASASGAGLMIRRDRWEALGGFAAEYFAYSEDAEISVRCWHRGWRVVYVPDAVVVHRYEFARNPRKLYLLERNRLLLVLTTFQRRTLLLIAPPLLALEGAMLVVASVQGWGREKLRGWSYLIRHGGWVRDRRAQLQAERTVPDRALAHLIAGRIEAANVPLPRGAGVLNAGLAAWWRIVRRLL